MNQLEIIQSQLNDINNKRVRVQTLMEQAKKQCEEIEMPSLPLGGMKKRKHKAITKVMKPGDAFIFYTDGIIECSAENGEMFGYERFYKLFTDLMKNNKRASEALAVLHQSFEDFREQGPRADDVTMIIVKKL